MDPHRPTPGAVCAVSTPSHSLSHSQRTIRTGPTLVCLAEAYGLRGQPTEGLPALTEAQHLVAYTSEQLVRADMFRVHGELLSSGAVHSQAGALAPPGTIAEGLLQQVLLLARQQQAKIMELRAAVSLSRIW